MELKMSFSKSQQIIAYSSSSRQKQPQTAKKNPNVILNNVTEYMELHSIEKKNYQEKISKRATILKDRLSS